jgi:choline-sulfatase
VIAPRRHFARYWPHSVTAPKIAATGDAIEHPIVRQLVARSQSEQLDPEAVLRTRAGYFACVDYLDEILGDLLLLLARDGLLENTIIVYASDHGELAGEHGLWDKYVWHEASIRAPWLISTRRSVVWPTSRSRRIWMG